MSDQRPASMIGQLARRGFAEPAGASAALAMLDVTDPEVLLDALAGAADPDQALAALGRFQSAGVDIGAVAADADWLAAVAAVTGMSTALVDHLVRHPGSIDRLRAVDVGAPGRQARRDRLLLAVGADPR